MALDAAQAGEKMEHAFVNGQEVAKMEHLDGTVDYVDANAVGGDVEALPRGYYWTPQFLGTFVAVCLASCCAYLGWVLPANTLSLINADLGNSPDIGWVATVWTLGCCVGFLLIGRLSDIFGRKWMIMSVTVLSLVGCILGSCAHDVHMLIGANLLNGLAAAGQLSFGITLGELVPNRHRGAVASICFLSSLPFAVFGPVIARSFINNTASKWRWSYFLGDILNAVALVLFFFLYHPPSYTQLHVAGKTKWQAVREQDFVGIFLFVAGNVLFLVGLSWGGTTYPWASAQTLATLLVGVATFAAFVAWEAWFCRRYGARLARVADCQPLMPPHLFRNRGFVALVVCATIGAMVYYSMTVLWPTIIAALYTTDSIQVGWESSVVGGGILLGQALSGCCLSYLPRVRWQVVLVAAAGMAFITPLASITADTHRLCLAIGTLGLLCMGYIENVCLPGVTLVNASQDIGLATGVMGSIRSLGGAVAQAMYASVLNNKLAANIPRLVGPAAAHAGLPPSSLPALYAALAAGSNLTADAVPGLTPAVQAAVGPSLKAAYAASFKIVFYCTIPFSCILLAAAFFVPNMEPFLHNNVAKKLQRPQDISAAEHAAARAKPDAVHAEDARASDSNGSPPVAPERAV